MDQERLRDMLEEVRECGSEEELSMLAKLAEEEGCGAIRDAVAAKKVDLGNKEGAMVQEESRLPEDVGELRELAKVLLAELEAERRKEEAREKVLLPRVPRSYRLLKTDVSWTTKPQVVGLMRILEANFRIGEVVGEDEIVAAVVANRRILCTVQPPKRIWDYYKGNHADGLQAHGNVEKL